MYKCSKFSLYSALRLKGHHFTFAQALLAVYLGIFFVENTGLGLEKSSRLKKVQTFVDKMDQWTHCRITLPSAFIVILIVLIALMTFQEHSFSLMEIAIQKTPEPKSGMNRSPSSNDSVNSKNNNNNRNSVQRKKIHRSIPFCPKDDTRRGKYFYLDLRPSLISKRYCGLNNLDMASLKKNFGKCPLINRRPNCPLKEEVK